ncbi:MAG: glycosyltransferase family 2 protein [Rhodospirillales bacterium]
MTVVTGPLVSVLVPAHNAAGTIAAALDTATGQTWPEIEIIVVDDGSTDETASIVAGLAAADPRIRLIRRPNGGVSAARNSALAAARGAWLAPLDADDLWRRDKIERQLARTDDPETVCVYGWYVPVDAEGRALPDRVSGGQREGMIRDALLLGNFVGPGSSPLLRRSAVEAAGGWDETLRGNEDHALYLRLAETGRFRVVPEVLVGYRQRPDSVSRDRRMMWRTHGALLRHAAARPGGADRATVRRARATYAWYLAFQAARAGAVREATAHLLRLLANQPGFVAAPAVRTALMSAVRRILGPRSSARPPTRAVDFHAVAPDLRTLSTAEGPDDVGARQRRRPVAHLPATRRGG